jgi:hypothetical protein
MRSTLKIVASALLLINSIGAIFGGSNLINDPSGNSLQLSLNWLKYSPFHDYLVPGIVLFIANGLFGIIILATMIDGYRKYSILITAQGIILIGWLAVQVMMIRTIIGLHIFTFTIGVLLVLTGWILTKLEHATAEQSTLPK